MDTITIENKTFQAYRIPVQNSAILVIVGSKGLLGCGYISLETAEKLGHALAIVKGVSTYDDMLSAKVVAVSSAASALGITIGMSGKETLLKLAISN